MKEICEWTLTKRLNKKTHYIGKSLTENEKMDKT